MCPSVLANRRLVVILKREIGGEAREQEFRVITRQLRVRAQTTLGRRWSVRVCQAGVTQENTATVGNMETFIEISPYKNVGRTEGGTCRAILEAGLVV